MPRPSPNLLDTATAGGHDGVALTLNGGPNLTDPEREDLLRRLTEAERACRRWKWLALLGTPILSVLLVMAVSFGTSSYLMLRDAVRREQASRDVVLNVDGFITQSLAEVRLVDEAEEPAKMPYEPEP
jgi:hypothetical protein